MKGAESTRVCVSMSIQWTPRWPRNWMGWVGVCGKCLRLHNHSRRIRFGHVCVHGSLYAGRATMATDQMQTLFVCRRSLQNGLWIDIKYVRV